MVKTGKTKPAIFSYEERVFAHLRQVPSRPSAASRKDRRAWTGGGDAELPELAYGNSPFAYSIRLCSQRLALLLRLVGAIRFAYATVDSVSYTSLARFSKP